MRIRTFVVIFGLSIFYSRGIVPSTVPLAYAQTLVEETKIQGTLIGNTVRFATIEKRVGTPSTFEGKLDGDKMSGRTPQSELRKFTDRSSGKEAMEASLLNWTADRMQNSPPAVPQRHEFVPKIFQLAFSASTQPVLHIRSGDTVHTTTVDANGVDANGVARMLGDVSNPQTGPFYIEGAMPGDTLAVTLTRLRLNRDWAFSDDRLVNRSLGPDLMRRMNYKAKELRWILDLQHGVARPEKLGEHMKNYSVAMKPMLGCVGIAPEFGESRTGDSGTFGGNMDFNEIGEGATVYLSVNQPGALLYVGDGHAVQGDGELTGNALETSMDVEFTVQLLKHKWIGAPRVENEDAIIAMGLAGSIDDAFREATAGMASWLMEDYNLTPSELAQVLSTVVEYRISEVADRNAGVVARIRKRSLAGLNGKH